MFTRTLQKQLENQLFQGKALIIVGARQVGKTTLTQRIIERYSVTDNTTVRQFNCDNPTDREVLENKDLMYLQQVIGTASIVVIDEGQKVHTIGQTIKLLVDSYGKEKQIIVTGSSSIHLLQQTQEALTGRKYVYTLYPLSMNERYAGDPLQMQKELESLLRFGQYPEVAAQPSFEQKKQLLQEIASSYLYKDILELYQVRHSTVLKDLLRALALQVGSEVSHTELAGLLGVDKNTVDRYIDLLEQSYIIFRLPPYARNKRKEISKLKKVYFYDVGVRNAIINNFNSLSQRDDVGRLWENFIIVERMKHRSYNHIYTNTFFWKTYSDAEVDLVEERDGKLYGYEFKWNSRKQPKSPASWQAYKNTSYEVIHPQNMLDFLT